MKGKKAAMIEVVVVVVVAVVVFEVNVFVVLSLLFNHLTAYFLFIRNRPSSNEHCTSFAPSRAYETLSVFLER